MEEVLIRQDKPSLWQSVGFTFFSVYFFLYIFPFPIGYNGNFHTISDGYYKGFNTFIIWVGHNFFHKPVMNSFDTGSGDRAFNYVQSFVMAALALVATVLWYLLNKRKNTAQLLYWLYIYIQAYLSVTLIRYGLIKVIKAQFPFPYYGLMETYSETSPMVLMNSFMGYSTVYSVFTGAVEVIAGLLILFRKTSLIGAIMAIGAMGNVVMINIGFDVPVKLHAFHLLLMAIYVLVPFAGNLRSLLIPNQSAHYRSFPRFISSNKKSHVITGGIICLVFILFYSNWQRTSFKYSAYGDGAFTKTPLFGFYQVKKFVRNMDTLLPLITDTSQWKMLSVVYEKRAAVKMMNDSTKLCRIVIDTSKKTIAFTNQEDTTYKAAFVYQQPDAMHLVLNGKIESDSVTIWLEKQDLKKFRLTNHEFHWVHESLEYK